MKYCEHCGKQIENDNAIVCPSCGEPTKSYNKQSDKSIIINNSASSSSSATGPAKQKVALILFQCRSLFIIY